MQNLGEVFKELRKSRNVSLQEVVFLRKRFWLFKKISGICMTEKGLILSTLCMKRRLKSIDQVVKKAISYK